MMNGFYPALLVGGFDDAPAALRSIGIVGEDAEFCLAGMEDGRTQPHVFEVAIAEKDAEPHRSAVVLLELESGLTGLWFGLFAHLRDTPQAAINSLAEEWFADEPPGDPPSICVFEWTQPKRSLQ